MKYRSIRTCFLPFSFTGLRQHFQLEILPEHTDITQCLPDGFQHDPIKHLFPDIVDFAGAGVALIIGADEMVLAVVLVGVAGAEVQLGPAVGAVEKAGENAGLSCFCRPAFVLFRSSCIHSHWPFSMMAGWVSSKTR